MTASKRLNDDVEEGSGAHGADDDEPAQCRICLDDDHVRNMISPCSCSGTSKFVHRACLDEWRAQERVPSAFTHCPTCHFEYITDSADDIRDRPARVCQFALHVVRDIGLSMALVQLVICGIAKAIQLLDTSCKVPAALPSSWPYYISSVPIFLFLVGFGAAVHDLYADPENRLIFQGEDNSTSWCYGNPTHCDGECMAILALILFICFALFGVMAMVACGSIVLKRSVQRHMHLIGRRCDAKDIVVRDLRC